MLTKQLILRRWSIAEIMMGLTFILAPLYYHSNIGGVGLRIPHNSTIWITALVFIFATLRNTINAKDFSIPKHFIYIAAFPLLTFISSIIAGVVEPTGWLFRFLYLFAGLAFIFCCFQNKTNHDRVLLMIAVSGLAHAVIGFIQFYLGADVPSPLPKSQTHLPYGLFQQINNQSTFLCTIILISFYLSSRPILFRPNSFFTVIFFLTTFLASCVVMTAGSRAAFLSMIIALPILVISRRRALLKNRKFVAILFSAVLVAVAWINTTELSRSVFDKTVAMQSGYSGSARLGIYSVSVDLFMQSPFVGHGIGSFPRVWQEEKAVFLEKHPNAKFPDEMVSHPHNEILLWLVEGGLIACSGILILAIGTLLILKKLGHTRPYSYFALLIPISIHTLVELPFYMSALHWLTFLIILSLPYQHLRVTRDNNMSKMARSFSSASLHIGFFLLLAFFIHTLYANRDFVNFYKGIQKENVLSIAKQNPYLYRDAISRDMITILYSSMQLNEKKNVIAYTKWARLQLETVPHIHLYITLARAYQFLGYTSELCNVVKKGLKIYPNNPQLNEFIKTCNK